MEWCNGGFRGRSQKEDKVVVFSVFFMQFRMKDVGRDLLGVQEWSLRNEAAPQAGVTFGNEQGRAEEAQNEAFAECWIGEVQMDPVGERV